VAKGADCRPDLGHVVSVIHQIVETRDKLA
jgi:hypothetical protein